jgi:Icc-related predicted phosphoesterase
VTDLHGHPNRYRKLFQHILREHPAFVFLGGDLLPHGLKEMEGIRHFSQDYLFPSLASLRDSMGDKYPQIFVILGNDDQRSEEEGFIRASKEGLFHYLNCDEIEVGNIHVIGYPFVPPTPFQLKDWEKYDVSRYVDPGCLHPTEGFRSVTPDYDTEYANMARDLDELVRGRDLAEAVFLFHSPPYKTALDRAALDGQMVDHVPLDVHIGSIAIKRFIEKHQPRVTLHGHVHESTRLTGEWMEKIGGTYAFNAAHDGNELCIIRFRDIMNPESCSRILA